MTEKKKVLIAMSGGVDSSVAAALLKKQGYELIGATMILHPEEEFENENAKTCCSLSSVEDARSVAFNLDIPFYALNFKEAFQKKVIDYFVDEYMLGRTPNPCIACNKFLKFDSLLQRALELEMDYVATGHYAKVFFDKGKKRYLIAKAKDLNKDQSYALYNLTQKQLKRVLLPLGEYTKPEIREMASQFGFVTADKPESQEICFIPDNNYRRFLKEKTPKEIKPGSFLDTAGNVIGKHQGIPFYTIGQRKNLGLALGYPAYVVDIDYGKNAVIIGKKDEVFSEGLIASKNNFILFDDLKEPMDVEIKIRYKANPEPATILKIEDDKVKVDFKKPLRSVTPGQAVVYYQGDLVVGGGTIESKF